MHSLNVRRFLTPIVTVGFVVVWFFVLRPTALGGPLSLEIVSGQSMEPQLHTGDLVIARSQSTYSAGDLIVFRVPSGQVGAGASIVHRIVSGDSSTGFVTKGDNNPSPDAWHPTASDVLGRSWIELPGVGSVLAIARRPAFVAAFLATLVAVWFYAANISLPRRKESQA
jgi:signal peptidase I